MTPARSSPAAWLLALVLGLVAGGCAVSGGPTPGATSAPPSATRGPSATESPSSASPTPGGSTVPACDAESLAARITLWEGAAGHRIATVLQPQLIDGRGMILINGATPQASPTVTMVPRAVLTTLVQDGNYCGLAPAAPVTLAFVLPGGEGRILAMPLSQSDTSGVPPCLGNPGSRGDIEMRPWQVGPL